MVADPASGAAEHPVDDPPYDLRRRSERDDDAGFLLELFRDTRGAMLAGLEPGVRDLLLRQQFAGQAMTYRARFPDALFDIVEHDGAAIGRIVEDRTLDVLTLVDIALLAAWRGHGIGTRLLRDILAAADAAGVTVRLSVDAGNLGARRLYERLGFAVVGFTDVGVAMERLARARAPGS